jgi:hypothetical protein
MLAEVGMMQRFTVFLGNPVLTVAVVLAALLVGSGVGSFVARTRAPQAQRVATVGIVATLLVLAFLASPLLRAALHSAMSLPLGVRIAFCALFAMGAGLPMGMPFPSGLTRVAKRSRSFVPWAWGINGMLSVVASLTSYLLGVYAGYTTIFVAGISLYGLALVVNRRV